MACKKCLIDDLEWEEGNFVEGNGKVFKCIECLGQKKHQQREECEVMDDDAAAASVPKKRKLPAAEQPLQAAKAPRQAAKAPRKGVTI